MWVSRLTVLIFKGDSQGVGFGCSLGVVWGASATKIEGRGVQRGVGGAAELMRLLVDVEGLDWEAAWSITIHHNQGMGCKNKKGVCLCVLVSCVYVVVVGWQRSIDAWCCELGCHRGGMGLRGAPGGALTGIFSGLSQ